MPDQNAQIILENHAQRIEDHETRLRFQERWSIDHEARDAEQHRQMTEAIGRLTSLEHRLSDKTEVNKDKIAHAFAEIGKLKLRMSLIMGLAGGVGGIIASIVTAIAIKVLGV